MLRIALLLVVIGLLFGAQAHAQDLLDGPQSDQRGAWRDLPCVGPEGKARSAGHWLAGGVTQADGIIRASVAVKRRAELGIFFHAQPADSGYVLRLKEGKIRLERVDAGRVAPLTSFETLNRPRRFKTLDVTVVAAGGWLIAQVNAPGGGANLGALIARDSTYASGRVGLRRADSARQHGCASRLSIEPLCGPTSALPPGPLRYIVTKKSPPGDFEVVDETRRGVVVEAPPETLMRALCGGLELLDIRGETPLKYVDPTFLETKGELEETPRGFVIDRSYKDPEMVEALLRGYRDRYPEQTRLVELGTTHGGRPIWALVISADIARAGGKPSVLLDGAHHGNEPLSVEFVLHAIQTLLEHQDDPRIAAWLEGLTIWTIPVLNPDGLHAHMHRSRRMGRKNGLDTDGDGVESRRDGVDINRNYPFKWGALGERGSASDPLHGRYRGPSAGSEPEIRALIQLADREHFVASISYHTGTTAVLSGYTIDDTLNPEPNEAWAIGELISDALPPLPGRQRYTLKPKLYAVDGSNPNWMRFAHGTVAFVLEGSKRSPLEREARAPIVENVARSWQALFDRVLGGPGISGWIVDARGAPLPAEVRVLEQSLFEGERWTARCRDGRFDRLVVEPGEYTIQASLGGATTTARVIVEDASQVAFTTLRLDLSEADAAVARAACPAPSGPWGAALLLPLGVASLSLIRATMYGAAQGAATSAASPPPQVERGWPSRGATVGPAPPKKPSDAPASCGCATRRRSSEAPAWSWVLLLGVGLLRFAPRQGTPRDGSNVHSGEKNPAAMPPPGPHTR